MTNPQRFIAARAAKAPAKLVASFSLAVAMLAAAGCATLGEIAALRRVAFAYDRIDGVRLAGIRLDPERRYSDVGPADVARLIAATLSRDVPLDMVVHLRAENPPENTVAARLVELEWTLFIEDRRSVSGRLANTILIPPGEPVDVPLGIQLDLADLFDGGARDLFDLALAIAGYGGSTREIRVELLPTIQTALGPIQYPAPIVVRREAGSR